MAWGRYLMVGYLDPWGSITKESGLKDPSLWLSGLNS